MFSKSYSAKKFQISSVLWNFDSVNLVFNQQVNTT